MRIMDSAKTYFESNSNMGLPGTCTEVENEQVGSMIESLYVRRISRRNTRRPFL